MPDSSDFSALPPAVAELCALLSDALVDFEVVAPGVPMPTVPLAAAAIGVAEEQIIKSLLFRDPRGSCVLAIASGTGKIDRRKLARAADLDRLKLADPATVLAVTGFPAGGVPPVGHRTSFPVVLDRRTAALDAVWGGAGVEEMLLQIRPPDIIRLTNAVVAEIVVDEDAVPLRS